MKIYKHNNKEQYLFINDIDETFVETFKIEKFKQQISTDFFDLSEKEDKKAYEKYIEKNIKKGFEPYTIPTEVQEKTDALMAKFEFDKPYYFVEKNTKKGLNSNVVSLSLIELNGEYSLYRLSSEYEDDNDKNILPTLENFVVGHIPTETDKLTQKNVANTLSYYITMPFVLDFDLLSLEQAVSLCTGKLITKETVFEGKLYKSKNASRYFKIAPKPDLDCVQFINYTINNNEIESKVVSYAIVQDPENIKAILKNFDNPDAFEKPITEEEFFKQYKNKEIAPKYLKKPIKKDVDLPKFPLEAPLNQLELANFEDAFLEENKYYFFANTTAENPLDWQVVFIVLADEKEDWYCYAKPFSLKDFNKVVSDPKEIELSYSDDRRDFAKKIKKTFKKAEINNKSIKTETIFEILSGQKIADLSEQEKLQTFITQTKREDTIVVDIFSNYACMKENTINHLYWQFFKNDSERVAWLKTYQTTETKLYDDESEFILKHTQHYIAKNEPEVKAFKKSLIENPLLKKIFSDTYDIKKFNKSTLATQEAMHIKGDYIFSSEKDFQIQSETIIIEGDLIVDGTLHFKANSSNYIIIKGDLKAENLIVSNDCQLIFVEGNVDINGITKDYFRFISANAKTKILLHTHKEALDIVTNFEYTYEVSFFSNAITNREVISKSKYGSLYWDEDKIWQLLTSNQPFIADKIEQTKTDLDEYYKNKFEKRMLDWGCFYPEYAGCEKLSICEDNEIKGNCIYPGSGDWVVNDLRGKSGTYGVSHDDYSICKLKVKKPSHFGIDYTQKPLKLMVGAEELMTRYVHISMLYMNWAHRTTAAFSTEEELKEKYKKYEMEKTVFKDDPHLALYWLNHFGATLDKKYDEVVAIINEHNLIEKLPLLKEPLAFFKKTDAFYNLEIEGGYASDKKEFEDLFLKRRAYLVHFEQNYKNYDITNIVLWWKAITIYPKVEERLIVRMRWLKNNLKKCDAWEDFDKLIANEPKDIPLLSYIFACNPNTAKKEKTTYADMLINELFEHRDEWKTPHKKPFGEILLWDVREFISDKTKLQEVAKFYFQGNETCKEYQDIQSVLGIENENIEEIREALEKLSTAFEGYDRFKTPSKEKEKYHEKVVNILSEFEPELLLEVVQNIKNHELAKRCFVYLWNVGLANKKEALVKLFITIEFSGHDISSEIFGADFAKLIKDEQDPNLEIAKAFLAIPKADFRNDYMWEISKEAATKFFLGVAHLPKVFDYLIETIDQKPSKENEKIIDAIYTTLFSTEYDSKINPTLKFSKEQIETMLETICHWFLKYGYHAEAYRSIYYCANPLAEAWIKEHHNNKKWLKQFAHIKTFYNPLDEELNDALESALEFMEDEKHNAYLEYKDEKSHKFWKIDHYGEGYTVTYGKVGTEGQSKTKEFDSSEEAYKAGDKLVASKLKKGYENN